MTFVQPDIHTFRLFSIGLFAFDCLANQLAIDRISRGSFSFDRFNAAEQSPGLGKLSLSSVWIQFLPQSNSRRKGLASWHFDRGKERTSFIRSKNGGKFLYQIELFEAPQWYTAYIIHNSHNTVIALLWYCDYGTPIWHKERENLADLQRTRVDAGINCVCCLSNFKMKSFSWQRFFASDGWTLMLNIIYRIFAISIFSIEHLSLSAFSTPAVPIAGFDVFSKIAECWLCVQRESSLKSPH